VLDEQDDGPVSQRRSRPVDEALRMRNVSKGSPRERLVRRPGRVIDRHGVERLRVRDDEAEARVPVHPGGRASTRRDETESGDHYGDESCRHRSRVNTGSSPENSFNTEVVSSGALTLRSYRRARLRAHSLDVKLVPWPAALRDFELRLLKAC
jgi:hypothetical protein